MWQSDGGRFGVWCVCLVECSSELTGCNGYWRMMVTGCNGGLLYVCTLVLVEM